MTIIATIWVTFGLSLVSHIGLYFLLPFLVKRNKENSLYRKRLLDDNIELARMIQKKE